MHDHEHAQDIAFVGRQTVETDFSRVKNIRMLEDTYLQLMKQAG